MTIERENSGSHVDKIVSPYIHVFLVIRLAEIHISYGTSLEILHVEPIIPVDQISERYRRVLHGAVATG